MQENRGTCAHDKGIARTGLSVREGIQSELARGKASLGSSGSIMHSLMNYTNKVFLFYSIVNEEHPGETGWPTLPLAFPEEL